MPAKAATQDELNPPDTDYETEDDVQESSESEEDDEEDHDWITIADYLSSTFAEATSAGVMNLEEVAAYQNRRRNKNPLNDSDNSQSGQSSLSTDDSVSAERAILTKEEIEEITRNPTGVPGLQVADNSPTENISSAMNLSGGHAGDGEAAQSINSNTPSAMNLSGSHAGDGEAAQSINSNTPSAMNLSGSHAGDDEAAQSINSNTPSQDIKSAETPQTHRGEGVKMDSYANAAAASFGAGYAPTGDSSPFGRFLTSPNPSSTITSANTPGPSPFGGFRTRTRGNYFGPQVNMPGLSSDEFMPRANFHEHFYMSSAENANLYKPKPPPGRFVASRKNREPPQPSPSGFMPRSYTNMNAPTPAPMNAPTPAPINAPGSSSYRHYIRPNNLNIPSTFSSFYNRPEATPNSLNLAESGASGGFGTGPVMYAVKDESSTYGNYERPRYPRYISAVRDESSAYGNNEDSRGRPSYPRYMPAVRDESSAYGNNEDSRGRPSYPRYMPAVRDESSAYGNNEDSRGQPSYPRYMPAVRDESSAYSSNEHRDFPRHSRYIPAVRDECSAFGNNEQIRNLPRYHNYIPAVKDKSSGRANITNDTAQDNIPGPSFSGIWSNPHDMPGTSSNIARASALDMPGPSSSTGKSKGRNPAGPSTRPGRPRTRDLPGQSSRRHHRNIPGSTSGQPQPIKASKVEANDSADKNDLDGARALPSTSGESGNDAQEGPSSPERIKGEVMSLLVESKNGILLRDVYKRYRECYGRRLLYTKRDFGPPIRVLRDIGIKVTVTRDEMSDDWLIKVTMPGTSTRNTVPTPRFTLVPSLPRGCIQFGEVIPVLPRDTSRPGQLHRALIGVVFSPSNFTYLKYGENNHFALNRISSQMRDYYNIEGFAPDLEPEDIRVNMYCAVPYGPNWYRGVIIDAEDPTLVMVRYVDFGMEERLSPMHLRALRREWAELPMQAIRARLDSIIPPGGAGNQWPPESIAAFRGFVDKRPVYVHVVAIDYRYSPVAEVALIETSTRTERWIDIELVRAGLAEELLTGPRRAHRRLA